MNAIVIDNFAISEEISGGGSFEHQINMEPYNPNGFVSLQVKLAGAGALTCAFQLSNNGVDFVVPNGAVDVFSGVTAGDAFYGFEPNLAQHLKLVFTETSGSPITLSAWLALQ